MSCTITLIEKNIINKKQINQKKKVSLYQHLY